MAQVSASGSIRFRCLLPGDDDYLDVLKLRSDGVTPVAPEVQVSGMYWDAYGDLVDYLQRQGYLMGTDLWLFPYDWRQDVDLTSRNLDTLVTQALVAANGGQPDPAAWTTRRVDIVAHSLGGLVGRAYIADPARAARVDQLITLGSPQFGATKALKALVYGDQFGPWFLGIGLNPSEVRDLSRNMAAGMELLPSRAYDQLYDNSDSTRLRPWVEDRDIDGDGISLGVLGYDQANASCGACKKTSCCWARRAVFMTRLIHRSMALSTGCGGRHWSGMALARSARSESTRACVSHGGGTSRAPSATKSRSTATVPWRCCRPR